MEKKAIKEGWVRMTYKEGEWQQPASEDEGVWVIPSTRQSFDLEGGSIIVEEAEAGTIRERYTSINGGGGDVANLSSVGEGVGDKHMPGINENEELDETAMQKEKEKRTAEQESTKANTAKAIQFEEVREKIISIAEERGIDHRTLMRMFDTPQ